MTRTDLAYAAGIIDGEGSIQIQRHRRSDYHVGYHYVMNIQVSMVDPEAILWLKQTFGGSLQLYPARGKRQEVYHWTITTNNAATFLQLILPYLKVKKAQAEIALEFQAMKSSVGHSFCKGHHKPLVLLEAEAVLAQKMRDLHRKGRRTEVIISREGG